MWTFLSDLIDDVMAGKHDGVLAVGCVLCLILLGLLLK